jgi:AbrB family looped-hinge helix DNA binding protein
MVTRVSTKGQVVIPVPLRKTLGLRAGDPLDISVDDGRIVLTPRRSFRRKAKIVEDPVTGIPVLTLGPDAPVLTHEQVKAMLADFP